jgi:hypothetical protein
MIGALLLPHLPSLAVAMSSPSLHRPIIVHSKGIVTSPPSLRGTSVARAQSVHPHASIVLADAGRERSAWQTVVEAVFDFTPYVSDVMVGRLFFAPDDPQRLRRLVERTDGHVGLASTRTLALLAAAKASAGSIVAVDDDDVTIFLQSVGIGDIAELPEVGLDDDAVEKFRLFGLPNLGAVRRLSRRHLQAQFGDAGLRLHDLLQSLTDRQGVPLYRPPVDLFDRERFDEGTPEPAFLIAALSVCLQRLVEQLRPNLAGRVEVALLDRADAPYRRRARLLARPTNDERKLQTQAATMVQEMAGPTHSAWGIAVRLASIHPPNPEQVPMFRPRATAHDLAVPLAERFPHAIKRIVIREPWAYLPERFCSLEP